MTPESLKVVDVMGCARCWGPGHRELAFARLRHPVIVGSQRFDWWASCPTTGDPLLMSDRVELPPVAATTDGGSVA